MAILNKYKRWKPILLLDKSRYYDFILSLDDASDLQLNGELTKQCLISYIDMNNSECVLGDGSVASLKNYSYNDAVNDGYTLSDIGLTATDNGQIIFNKETITEDEYLSILTDSVAEITSDDKRLHLNKVSGNTQNYLYDCEYVTGVTENYYSFNGGFLQGFFKGFGYDYQALPQYVDYALNLEFVIRPNNTSSSNEKTLNSVNPNNSGTFFYVGTRSENKFIQFYNYDLSVFKKREIVKNNSVINTGLSTSQGHKIESINYPDIVTDNGYIIYSRRLNDYTTSTWVKGDKLTLVDNAKRYKDNLYLLLNRGCTGYTINTLETDYTEEPKDFKGIINDLVENAFSLRVTEDGRVGYRYLVRDCDSELQYSIKEEYTFPNKIRKGEWNVVNVLFKILDGELDKCKKPYGKRKMKIYIYVDGYLKLVSQELPELRLRELNESYDKQEFVPFNISLGGGTQGLSESTWVNSYEGFPYILPIEEYFAGSFIGDIKSFKMYDCQIQYMQIKNNFLFEKKNMG